MTQPGQIVADRYRIISTLGNGQYGVVYRAEDVTLQKEVALKMLNVTDANSTALLRFQKEARAAAKLKHSNIVTVLDFRLDDQNNFYLVLELIQGMNLRSLIASHGRLAPDECMPLFLQVLSGLAHAHENGVIHRDLNPNNILVDFRNPQQPTAKIVDFGLARLADEDQRLTREGVAVGTPEFMSPEQCHGTEIDARSDIYSFGCLMFDALTGNPPYQRDTVVDTIMCHINYDAPTLYDVCPDVDWPRHLPEIVAKSLNRDPNLRYQNAEELAAALRAIPIETHAIELEIFENDVKQPSVVSSKQSEIAKTAKNVPKSVIAACIAIVMLGALIANTLPGIIDSMNPVSTTEQPSTKRKKTPRSKARSGSSDADNFGADLLLKAADPDDPNEIQKAVTTPQVLPGKQPGSFDAVGCADDNDLKVLSNRQEIKSLRIQKAFLVKGTGLRFLKGLKLEHLQLRGSALDDVNLATYMPYLPTLTRLSLGGNSELTGSTLQELAKKVPNVDFFDLSASGLTDSGLTNLLSFKRLKSLSICKCPHVTGSTLSALAELPNLTELRMIGATKINPANWSCLDKFANLRVIDATGCAFKPNDLRFLRNSKVLNLILSETNLNDDGLKVIAESPTLTILWIPHANNVSANGIKHLRNSSISNLNAAGLPMTEAFLKALCEMKKLVVFDAASTGLTYGQAERLLKNSSIKLLYVSAPIERTDVINLQKHYPDRRIVQVPLDEASSDRNVSSLNATEAINETPKGSK